MNPYLKTLFQNLIGAEQRLEEIHKHSSDPIASCGSSMQVEGALKKAGIAKDSDIWNEICDAVDRIGQEGNRYQSEIQRLEKKRASQDVANAQIAIETYMHIHYKFTEPN